MNIDSVDSTFESCNATILWYFNTIKEAWKLHSVNSKDMGEIFVIEMRKYACFCEFCIGVDGHNLINVKNMYT